MNSEIYNLEGEVILLPGFSDSWRKMKPFFNKELNNTQEEFNSESYTELEIIHLEGVPIPQDGFSLEFVSHCLTEMGAKVVHIEPEKGVLAKHSLNPDRATMVYIQNLDTPPEEYKHLPVLTQEDFVARYNAGRQAYADALNQYRREAYIALLERGDENSSDKSSRYFGRPWMPNSMKWPTDMNFVLQLNIETLPQEWKEKLGGAGLLLFFHNSTGDYDSGDVGKNQDTNAAMSRVVIVDLGEPGGLREFPPDIENRNNTLVVKEWKAVANYPDTYNENLDFKGLENFSEVDTRLFDENLLLEDPNLPVAPFHNWRCDKLGGWPHWEQGDETLVDKNGNKMHFVYQVGHDGLLDKFPEIEFPTWGVGHIFYSPDTGELYYQWACD